MSWTRVAVFFSVPLNSLEDLTFWSKAWASQEEASWLEDLRGFDSVMWSFGWWRGTSCCTGSFMLRTGHLVVVKVLDARFVGVVIKFADAFKKCL